MSRAVLVVPQASPRPPHATEERWGMGVKAYPLDVYIF